MNIGIQIVLGVKVNNIIGKNGNPIQNQFEIVTKDGIYFQSYSSVIALKGCDGKIYLDENYYDYSRTTGKYRNIFLGETIVDTRKKIDSGEYILTNLNV